MKDSENKLGVGIWLDANEAFIIKVNNDDVTIENIKSNIEHKHYKSGIGLSTAYRFQAVKSEKSQLEKQKHQFNQYFEDILTHFEIETPLLIFGPAETKTAFLNLLKAKKLDSFVRAVETQDKMTENQMKAYVKNFF